MFYLILTQDATEKISYLKPVEEPLRLELNFSSPLENAFEFFVMGERWYAVAANKLDDLGKNI